MVLSDEEFNNILSQMNLTQESVLNSANFTDIICKFYKASSLLHLSK